MFADHVFNETRLLPPPFPHLEGMGNGLSALQWSGSSLCLSLYRLPAPFDWWGMDVRALTWQTRCEKCRMSGPRVTQRLSEGRHKVPGLSLGARAGTWKTRWWVRRGHLGSRTDTTGKHQEKGKFNVSWKSQAPQTQKLPVLWSCWWATMWKRGKGAGLESREPGVSADAGSTPDRH